jgi:peptidoglycan-associated lipoprotein
MISSTKSTPWITWALWLALALGLSVSGCRCGGEDVATDNTQDLGAANAGQDLDDVNLEDEPFAQDGTATGDQSVDSEDLDADRDAVAVELTDVFFDYDSFDLDAEDRAALAQNARVLRDAPTAHVTIEGHCDERGTVQYNLALGEKRAKETKRYLVSLGVPAQQLEIVSYGKERPFAVGEGEAVWSQNRRSHFVVRSKSR